LLGGLKTRKTDYNQGDVFTDRYFNPGPHACEIGKLSTLALLSVTDLKIIVK
jgi:hypothetical protein